MSRFIINWYTFTLYNLFVLLFLTTCLYSYSLRLVCIPIPYDLFVFLFLATCLYSYSLRHVCVPIPYACLYSYSLRPVCIPIPYDLFVFLFLTACLYSYSLRPVCIPINYDLFVFLILTACLYSYSLRPVCLPIPYDLFAFRRVACKSNKRASRFGQNCIYTAFSGTISSPQLSQLPNIRSNIWLVHYIRFWTTLHETYGFSVVIMTEPYASHDASEIELIKAWPFICTPSVVVMVCCG